jgi:hypothetical protein
MLYITPEGTESIIGDESSLPSQDPPSYELQPHPSNVENQDPAAIIWDLEESELVEWGVVYQDVVGKRTAHHRAHGRSERDASSAARFDARRFLAASRAYARHNSFERFEMTLLNALRRFEIPLGDERNASFRWELADFHDSVSIYISNYNLYLYC